MPSLVRPAVLLAVAVGAAVAAPAAGAASLKGQVVGSPYVADAARTAVPVLFSKQSARAAHLRSPLGLLIVNRRAKLAAPGGAVTAGLLHLGDRFRATARVPAGARTDTFPRIPARSFAVTKRSTTLSNDELTQLVRQTQKSLASLSQVVNNLASYTQRGFADVNSRIAALRADLDSVMADLASLKTSVGALSAQLTATTADLQTKIAQVRSDLQPQIDSLVASVATLTATLGSCSDPSSVLGRICALESQVSLLTPVNLSALTGRVDQLSGALTGVVNDLTGLSLTGDLPAGLTSQVNTLLGNLFGLQGTVGGLTSDVGVLQGQMGTVQTGLATVTGLVGGVDVGALSSTLGGLTGQVTNLIADLGADPTGLNPTALTSLTSQVTGAQSQITGILQYLSPGDGNLATTADNVLDQATSAIATLNNVTIPGINSKLTTICTTWRNLLSAQTLDVVNLLSVLTGHTTLPTLPGC
jgi:hypothetical protein